MKKITKQVLCAVLALIMLLAAGCAQKSEVKSFALQLEGVAERGGVVIEGITPGMSKAEAEAAGAAFGPEPMAKSTGETGNTSETYPAKNIIMLGKVSFMAPEFQFMNGKLVDITMTTKDAAGAQAAAEQLKKELGEPEIQNTQINSSDSTEVQFWEIDQGEYMLRIAFLTRMSSGKAVGANLQIGYIYYDMFPDYGK